MNLKPEEITEILKQQIAQFDDHVVLDEVGTVLSVGDGIARVYGLADAMAGEMLSFEFKRQHFPRHGIRQSVDTGNAIADGQHRAYFVQHHVVVELGDLLL